MATTRSLQIQKLSLPFALIILLCSLTRGEESTENHFTPIPLMDINKDLRPLYFGSQSDYFISTYEADSITARQVCQNLTDITGKHFHLLVLETAPEFEEIRPYLDGLEIPGGIWTAGEKSFTDQGTIGTFWSTYEGPVPMSFKNFRQGLSNKKQRVRRRRDIEIETKNAGVSNSSTSVMYPWLNIGTSEKNGKCRNGKYTPPECEPVECNVTMPECETSTPPCTVINQTECLVTRPSTCSAKCENCTVIPGACTAQPKPCTVKTEPCQAIQTPCNVIRPNCTTTRPPCKTIQPPCNVTTPPPCTMAPPRCFPTFSKDNCTTVTFPCKTNNKNETVCPEPKTVCEPSYKCPPPEVCTSPAIICPPPLIYCEPETTVCPEPIVECKPPAIYCPTPEVDCPEPEVVCEPPKVICSPPVVSCPGVVTTCTAPKLNCPPPKVNCPDPDVKCTEPQPCGQVPTTTPTPCSTEPTTTTTEKPCNGCGCILMSKEHNFKWDIEACRSKFHFVCEG